jgi:hypothetical protein
VPLFVAVLDDVVSPPVAVAPLLLLELPLSTADCEESPPLPPVALLIALPELPAFAVLLPEPLELEHASPEPSVGPFTIDTVLAFEEPSSSLSHRIPVPSSPLLVPASLHASPPLLSYFCSCFTSPREPLLFSLVVLEPAHESPDVALSDPLPEPPELDAELLLLVSPPVAPAVLLFVAFPLPDAL